MKDKTLVKGKIHYVGVNDRNKHLFEGMWPLPYGVSYNSYLIADDIVALIDTVDACYFEPYLHKIKSILGDRPVQYLVVNHMEPDHSGSIRLIKQEYPDIVIVGNKQTFDCPAPYGMTFDPQIAAKAPTAMSASGYADLIAKIPAGADWMIADAVGAEAIDAFAFDVVQDGLQEALCDPEGVYNGDVGKVEQLAEGLLLSGFAMQAAKSSRPASGMEHQFSHFWDMENLEFEGKHVSHGFKVGIGTLASTASLELLLAAPIETLDIDACVAKWKSWPDTEQEILRIFAGKPGFIERAMTETRNKYVDKEGLRRQLEAFKAAWPELKERVRKQIIPFEEVRRRLKLVGAPYEPEQLGISRARFRDTFAKIPYMRSRFSNIDIVYRFGLMDEWLERLFGKGGIWEVR